MPSGTKPLGKQSPINDKKKIMCLNCGNEISPTNLYRAGNKSFNAIGKIPYCKDCINNMYQEYLSKYIKMEYASPEKKAIERMCMTLNLYFNDKIFEDVVKTSKSKTMVDTPLIIIYIKQIMLVQYKAKNYDTTLSERYDIAKKNSISTDVITLHSNDDEYQNNTIRQAVKIFGRGFDADEYVYLYEQYCDWTSRHECNTKAQEEVFKNICLTQLQLLEAMRSKEDTKDLSAQLQKWLDTGKLQPKQNNSDTLSDAQTFGTLIDKWETTRPLPDIDDELKDVDKIGLYIDVFFRGHLSKMMNLKNSLSDLYDKYMAKYTVEKPEYNADEADDAVFETIFGRDLEDEV